MRGQPFSSQSKLQRDLLQSLKQQRVATPIDLVWSSMPVQMLPAHVPFAHRADAAEMAIDYLRQVHFLLEDGRLETDAWGRCRIKSNRVKPNAPGWAATLCLGASSLVASCSSVVVSQQADNGVQQRAYVQLQQVRAGDGSLMFKKCLYGESCEPITVKVMDQSVAESMEPKALASKAIETSVKASVGHASAVVAKPVATNEAKQTQQAENQVRAIRYTIYFGFNRFQLGPQGQAALSQIIKDLADLRVDRIAVSAGADPIGAEDVNARFAELRAQQVKAALQRGGVAAGLIEFDAPKEDITMERRGMPARQSAHAEMRRADVVVYTK